MGITQNSKIGYHEGKIENAMLIKPSSKRYWRKTKGRTSNSRRWTLKNAIGSQYLRLETVLPLNWVGPLG